MPSFGFLILTLKYRSGTFPFLKLPTEIRYEIYKLVLAPLLSKHAFIPDDKRRLVLKIQHFEDVYYDNLLNDVESILSYFSTADPELKRRYREEEKEVAALCKRFFYPSTTRAYEITFPRFFTRQTDPAGYENIPPMLLASIRNLSNVSCQIRQELGICAWAESILTIENGAFAEALLCLKERPAIHKGLKTLSIAIRWKFGDDCSDVCPGPHDAFADHTCSMVITSLLEFVDQHLQLDQIIIKLEVSIDRVRELLVEVNKPKWIDTLKALRCAKSFALLPSYMSEEAVNDPDYEKIGADLEKLLRPSVLTGPDPKGGVLDRDRAENEHEEPGFFYRIQANGDLLHTPSAHSEKHDFQFEKHHELQACYF